MMSGVIMMSEIMKAVLFLYQNVTGREIPYQYAREDDGSYFCWPELMPGLWGEGATLEEAENDMLDVLKEDCDTYLENAEEIKASEEVISLVMQVIMTGKEELKKCLHGKICGDT